MQDPAVEYSRLGGRIILLAHMCLFQVNGIIELSGCSYNMYGANASLALYFCMNSFPYKRSASSRLCFAHNNLKLSSVFFPPLAYGIL